MPTQKKMMSAKAAKKKVRSVNKVMATLVGVTKKPKGKWKRVKKLVHTKSGRVYGHGDYLTDAVDGFLGPRREGQGYVNKIAESGATALGNVLMPGFGSWFGKGASTLSRWLGFGDYSLQCNSLLNQTAPSLGRPNFTSKPGSVRLAWTEFVGAIFVSGSNFVNRNYILNPGNPALFPFMAPIALCFENFEFHGLIMHFDSTSSVAFSGNSPAVGQVTMATDYDVIDANYQNLREMEISMFATTQAPYDDQYHAIECKRGKNALSTMYTQPFSSVSQFPDDPRFSCLGNFQIATQGIPVSSGNPTIGNLYVTYDVTLTKPQLANNPNANFVQHNYLANINGTWTPSTLVYQNVYNLGTANVSGTGATTSGKITIDLGVLTPGKYMISISTPVNAAGYNAAHTAVPTALNWYADTHTSFCTYTLAPITPISFLSNSDAITGASWGGFCQVNLLQTDSLNCTVSFDAMTSTNSDTVVNYEVFILGMPVGLQGTRKRAMNKTELDKIENEHLLDVQGKKLQELENKLMEFSRRVNDKGVSPHIIRCKDDDESSSSSQRVDERTLSPGYFMLNKDLVEEPRFKNYSAPSASGSNKK